MHLIYTNWPDIVVHRHFYLNNLPEVVAQVANEEEGKEVPPR